MNHEGTKTPRDPIPERTNQVVKEIIDAAFQVHSQLGAGLLESVYEVCLGHELRKREKSLCLCAFVVERKVAIFKETGFAGFRDA